MKFLRILALMLAAIMCFGIGFAEEASDSSDISGLENGLEESIDDTEDDDTSLYDPILISALDVDPDDWLASSDMRAIFAVLMQLELYCNEELGYGELLDSYDTPTIYVFEPEGLEGLAVSVMYFYTDAELVVSATYIPLLGQYSSFQSELSLDPDVAMYALSAGGGFDEYYEIPFSDYYSTLIDIGDALNGD